MMGYGAGTWMGISGWLTMAGGIVLVIGLVLLVAWAIGRVGEGAGTRAQAQGPDALEVLRLRFARGEITADEYQAAKQVLENVR